MVLYSAILFIFGTIFGSFSSVLIERWHSGKGGIMRGRSECPSCHKKLGFFELFPLLSYIFQGGKCVGCKTHIPAFYPILELAMGVIFSLVGYAFYKLGYTWEDSEFWFILICSWITGVYIFYDIKYREIPDQIIVPGIYLCIILLINGYYYEYFRIFFDIHTYPTYHTFVYDHVIGALILYSFFYFQILIPGGFHLLKLKDYKNFGALIVSYFTFPVTILVDLFSKKDKETITIDIPTWIGGGDLRVALFLGLTLGTLHGVAAFAFAYILGSIVGITMIALAKLGVIARQKEIAFGPFLGIGWILSLLFYMEILDIAYNIF